MKYLEIKTKIRHEGVLEETADITAAIKLTDRTTQARKNSKVVYKITFWNIEEAQYKIGFD
jgi:hypothetical protein